MKDYNYYLQYADRLINESGIKINFSEDDIVKGKDFLLGFEIKKHISFTPYIYNLCSADCRFCSEQLIRGKSLKHYTEVSDKYFDKLETIFEQLKQTEIFLSLSGKEPSLSLDFIENVLITAEKFENIKTKVVYSNLSGLAKQSRFEKFERIVKKYSINRIECSRHDFDAKRNNEIMRFKNGFGLSNNNFDNIIMRLNEFMSTKLVCVIQKTGVYNCSKVSDYLEYAVNLGVKSVVFRELCVFSDCVTDNTVSNYILENMVEIYDIISKLNSDFKLINIKKGYYYFSFQYSYKGLRVDFEMSDYDKMELTHKGKILHKLIYYPDGQLCSDWNNNLPIC